MKRRHHTARALVLGAIAIIAATILPGCTHKEFWLPQQTSLRLEYDWRDAATCASNVSAATLYFRAVAF